MSIDELREVLREGRWIQGNSFGILKDLCNLVASGENREDAQELVLRALEHRDAFVVGGAILDALTRELGLFQYLDPAKLAVGDQIAYEVHRPDGLDGKTVFHAPQAAIYWRLKRGESVALSAPTSFGKSLIIDALIASESFQNILIIVPTIALIDETRRRLSGRFRSRYKVITHLTQSSGARNIYIATPERLLCQMEFPIGLDFFVIDEFYKLSPGRTDNDRCAMLNQVFYRLAKTVKQFYLLGPNVLGTSPECESQLHFKTTIESYRTVVSELHLVEGTGDEFERLLKLCAELRDPTIIFCSSPNRASAVARRLSATNLGQSTPLCIEAADWMASTYHPDWHVVDAMRKGIGVHHGRIPRALAQFVVRAFNAGQIRFLVCTSTLIEGVNTKAKNIVIFDNRINHSKIDLFTFNNIRGRSGRMGQHFVGYVYLFHPEPEEQLPLVDVPAYSQDETTPESLLIQLDDEDLRDGSRTRLQKYFVQTVVDYDTLKANIGLDPERQLAMAREIAAQPAEFQNVLRWSGAYPTNKQLVGTIELFWKHFDGIELGRRSVFRPSQLAGRLFALRGSPNLKALIDRQIPFADDADEAVRQVLDFVRLWCEFHFPRLLRALNRIQKDVFARAGLPAGDYDQFAGLAESLFVGSEIAALDEYGIPLDLARRLAPRLRSEGNLDRTLGKLRTLSLTYGNLSPFERKLVIDAQRHV